MIASLVIGILFLVLGLALRYWINRRKFYRRSPIGAESFSSYEKSVGIKFIERVAKWIAYALIIFGLLSLWVYSREKNDKEKQKVETKTEQIDQRR
ncbi:molybdenum ABC transporter permease [Flavobacterium hiemivividum]|uniref:Molybdenum ABC transporter permease n=1 Tax=Flavobacterium hiemivividum TaxID=2541734 RepID=A0A4R5CW68_9FLAO|nr:molybdenum ABC transporter permease [Flavobacterium hiemivividum]TDE04992.1 molybdenum ABC transporter permease [Flavobacterium hiemivividum]